MSDDELEEDEQENDLDEELPDDTVSVNRYPNPYTRGVIKLLIASWLCYGIGAGLHDPNPSGPVSVILGKLIGPSCMLLYMLAIPIAFVVSLKSIQVRKQCLGEGITLAAAIVSGISLIILLVKIATALSRM